MHKILKIVFLITITHAANAQTGGWRINLGAGLPEFTHLGAGYKFSNNNLASLNYGFLPGLDNSFAVITVEHSYFFKSSKKMKP